MGVPVLVIGKSGSGKSTSLRNFAENEIGLINVSKKPLPFRKKFESTIKTDDYQTVVNAISKTTKNSIVIDDAGYLIVNHFMNGHSKAGSGNAVFSFYNGVGDSFWQLVEFIKNLPDEKIVYFLMHEDKNDFGDIKPKTIGKILDETVCLEGMFTVVLRCLKNGDKHIFRTQTDGFDVAKSPMEMFENKEINNDLKFVDKSIRDYWDLKN
jgi:energy-coupling factor transporter ATP-binding protein EcfA2